MLIAISDAVMQQKAAQLGLKISSENGVAQAVSIIHQKMWVETRRRTTALY